MGLDNLLLYSVGEIYLVKHKTEDSSGCSYFNAAKLHVKAICIIFKFYIDIKYSRCSTLSQCKYKQLNIIYLLLSKSDHKKISHQAI